MNEYRITLTQRAKDDIIDIGDYIFFEIVESTHVVIILRIGYNRRNWKDILA